MSKVKSASFFKDAFYFLSYFLVGIFSCALAFFFVVEFLNPSLSKAKEANQNPALNSASKKESPNEQFKAAPANQPPAPNANNSIQSGANNAENNFRANPNNPSNADSQKNFKPVNPALQPKANSSVANSLQNSQKNSALKSPNSAEQNTNQQNTNQQNTNEQQFNANTSEQDTNADLLEIESYITPFRYDTEQKRDPFKNPTIISRFRAPVVGIKTPLEKYKLNELKLRGIIWNIKLPKALFEIPNHGFYTLTRGDKIGQNGVIFEIREDEVVIVETEYQIIGDNQTKKNQNVTILKLDRLRPGKAN